MIAFWIALAIFAIGFVMFMSGGIVNATGGDSGEAIFDISCILGSLSTIALMVISILHFALHLF